MKNLKLIFGTLILGAMVYGGTVAYSLATMSEQELRLIENIEALTEEEGGGGGIYNQTCYGAFSSFTAPNPYNVCGSVNPDPNVTTKCAGISNYKPLLTAVAGTCYKYL